MSDQTSTPLSPSQAEELARRLAADYLQACAARDPQHVGNCLMKLCSVAGVLMAHAEGSAVAAQRLHGTADFVLKTMPQASRITPPSQHDAAASAPRSTIEIGGRLWIETCNPELHRLGAQSAQVLAELYAGAMLAAMGSMAADFGRLQTVSMMETFVAAFAQTAIPGEAAPQRRAGERQH